MALYLRPWEWEMEGEWGRGREVREVVLIVVFFFFLRKKSQEPRCRDFFWGFGFFGNFL